MTINRWVGGAAAAAQVRTWTFAGTWNSADVVTVTVGSKSYAVTTGSATVATLLTTIQAALAALSATGYPEFAGTTGVTWTKSTTTLVATAQTAGVPFTVTITTNSALGTITPTDTTANAGPNSWQTAANWSAGVVPQSTLAAPVQANATAAAGGSLVDTTTYYWVITATNANGETVKSNEKTLTIAAPNQTAHLSWAAVASATGYKVYRSTTTGTYGATSLVTTITSGSTLTYNDTGTALTAGQPPGVSTAPGDAVVLDDPAYAVLYDLDNSTVTLASLTVTARFTGDTTAAGTLGLPPTNQLGGVSYPEYRPTYLKVGSPNVYIGQGEGSGSGRIKHDAGAVACSWYVYQTGTSPDDGLAAVMVLGSNAGNVLTVIGNSQVGVALLGGEAANLSGGLTVGPGASVRCGAGVTLATVTNDGGALELNAAVGTALVHLDGVTVVNGAGAVAQLNVSGGTVVYSTTGTLGGNTVVSGGGVLDFTADLRAKTVTNPITAQGGGTVLDSFKVVTALTVACPDGNAQVAWGRAFTLQRTA